MNRSVCAPMNAAVSLQANWGRALWWKKCSLGRGLGGFLCLKNSEETQRHCSVTSVEEKCRPCRPQCACFFHRQWNTVRSHSSFSENSEVPLPIKTEKDWLSHLLPSNCINYKGLWWVSKADLFCMDNQKFAILNLWGSNKVEGWAEYTARRWREVRLIFLYIHLV